MARELTRALDPARVAENLTRVRSEIGERPEILAAVKYLAVEALPALAEGGVTLVGENRAQELAEKQASPAAGAFTWDFIGHIQSRKVRDIVGRVRLIHSVGSDSVLDQLARHGTPETRVLIEVNVAREAGKSGWVPEDLPRVLERCPVRVEGLMTMPPLAHSPEDSRRWFAALAELAGRHGLTELSMGTSQDYRVAAEEGATIVRIGTSLYT